MSVVIGSKNGQCKVIPTQQWISFGILGSQVSRVGENGGEVFKNRRISSLDCSWKLSPPLFPARLIANGSPWMRVDAPRFWVCWIQATMLKNGWQLAASPQSDVFFVCLFVFCCCCCCFFFLRDVAVEQRKFFGVSSKCANCEERFFRLFSICLQVNI